MSVLRVFEFQPISYVVVKNDVNILDDSKRASGTLSVDFIKKIAVVCHTQISQYFNSMLLSCEFPDLLKAVHVSAIYRSSDPISKIDYRPISVHSVMSKVFERLLENRAYLLSTPKYQFCCALIKNYIAEHTLIWVTEIIRKTLDSKGVAGMISMDLSKAFNCMPQDLLITELNAYGFGDQSPRLIANYFSDWR